MKGASEIGDVFFKTDTETDRQTDRMTNWRLFFL